MGSTASAVTVTDLIARLTPFDAVEADHCSKAASWLASTDDVFRREKPATPAPHLVSYFAVLDRDEGRVLLVEHRLAGLWLPPGGHVEPTEHPAETVRREAGEELGIDAQMLNGDDTPFFLTWTGTVGSDSHTDVSLWFLLHGNADRELEWDRGEFADIRWWSPVEIRGQSPDRFDPHLMRFLSKLDADHVWRHATA